MQVLPPAALCLVILHPGHLALFAEEPINEHLGRIGVGRSTCNGEHIVGATTGEKPIKGALRFSRATAGELHDFFELRCNSLGENA